MPLTAGGCQIRPVGEAEMAALLGLYRVCEDFLALGPVAHASAAMIRSDLAASSAEGGSFCGIFHPVDGLIGVVDFTVGSRESERAEAHLALLMLARPYRGHGLGAQIVEAVEGEIWRAAGITTIAAEVQVNNAAAIRFWRRMGYRIVGGPELEPDGTTAYHLQKRREPKRI